MTNFTDARDDYHRRGWVTQPLVLDNNGAPKRAIVTDWTSLTLNDVSSLPWDKARGIGIILGPASGNLAVIDVDDIRLSEQIYATMISGNVLTRMVRTLHDGLHIYFQEETPTQPSNPSFNWQGRAMRVELRTKGLQVTAPPTPGYQIIQDGDLIVVPTIHAAWDSIARKLNIENEYTGTNYPKPWQPKVVNGDRNRAIYVEAHRLREARMPLAQAVEILRIRWESAYEQGGMSWQEAERTIQSAYRKRIATQINWGGIPT